MISLSNISEWNTDNVKDISNMFKDCCSLISLPYLYKWDISHIDYMLEMCIGCKSLTSFPNIQKWIEVNESDPNLFCKRKSLYALSNLDKKVLQENNFVFELTYKISKEIKIRILGIKFINKNKDKIKLIYNNYEIEIKEYFVDNSINKGSEIKFLLCLDKQINDISYLFEECDSLTSIEVFKNEESNENDDELDINNTPNSDSSFFKEVTTINSSKKLSYFPASFTNMEYMFSGCESLISLPDIANWNTSKVDDLSGIFKNCSSLNTFPDISKWNTSNVTNISKMFFGCNKLISLPDISKWDTSNVKDMNYLFYSCGLLIGLPDLS